MCQGNFLAMCSDPHTIGRNSGIVWAMVQVQIFLVLGGDLCILIISTEKIITILTDTHSPLLLDVI